MNKVAVAPLAIGCDCGRVTCLFTGRAMPSSFLSNFLISLAMLYSLIFTYDNRRRGIFDRTIPSHTPTPWCTLPTYSYEYEDRSYLKFPTSLWRHRWLRLSQKVHEQDLSTSTGSQFTTQSGSVRGVRSVRVQLTTTPQNEKNETYERAFIKTRTYTSSRRCIVVKITRRRREKSANSHGRRREYNDIRAELTTFRKKKSPSFAFVFIPKEEVVNTLRAHVRKKHSIRATRIPLRCLKFDRWLAQLRTSSVTSRYTSCESVPFNFSVRFQIEPFWNFVLVLFSGQS